MSKMEPDQFINDRYASMEARLAVSNKVEERLEAGTGGGTSINLRTRERRADGGSAGRPPLFVSPRSLLLTLTPPPRRSCASA
jgi:hypothetical protein